MINYAEKDAVLLSFAIHEDMNMADTFTNVECLFQSITSGGDTVNGVIEWAGLQGGGGGGVGVRVVILKYAKVCWMSKNSAAMTKIS